MKSDERQKKIDLNREKVAQKYLQQSKLREVKISNAKEKKLQNLQKKVDKYNQKQEAIIQLKEDQKKEREKEQFEIRAKQEEKEKKTSETRERYENRYNDLRIIGKSRHVGIAGREASRTDCRHGMAQGIVPIHITQIKQQCL